MGGRVARHRHGGVCGVDFGLCGHFLSLCWLLVELLSVPSCQLNLSLLLQLVAVGTEIGREAL